MATAKEQLLSMMNPQQARLLDQQMRDQQVGNRAQGAGMLSGLVQAYTGMGDTLQRAGGFTPMGANEAGAIQAQQAKLAEEKKKKELQVKLMEASPEQLETIYRENLITNPELAKAAEILRNKKLEAKKTVNKKAAAIRSVMTNKTLTAEQKRNIVQNINSDNIAPELALSKFGLQSSDLYTDNQKTTLINQGFDPVSVEKASKERDPSLLTKGRPDELEKELGVPLDDYTSSSVVSSANILDTLVANGIPYDEAVQTARRALIDKNGDSKGKDKPKLMAGVVEDINESVNLSLEAQGAANKAISMHDKYAELEPQGGILGDVFGKFKAAVGGQDAVSSLKTSFQGLVNIDIVNNLPPGVASDRDIELFSKGFPDSSWNSSEIKDWLKMYAKMKTAESVRHDMAASYMKEKGDLANFPAYFKKESKKRLSGLSSKNEAVSWEDLK